MCKSLARDIAHRRNHGCVAACGDGAWRPKSWTLASLDRRAERISLWRGQTPEPEAPAFDAEKISTRAAAIVDGEACR